jgi:hypothetical protein
MSVLLVFSLTGCSFFITKAPANDPGTRPLPCEESMIPPYADAGGAAALAVIGIASIPFKSDGSNTTFVIAEVVVPCRPSGQVRVHGELWEARCAAGADIGEDVRITALEELTLVVEPVVRHREG